MRWGILFALLAAVLGCSYFDGDRKETSEPNSDARVNELEAKRDENLAKLSAMLDADGYPGREDCDLTLWIGEARYAGAEVNLDLVEYSPGEIHRRPDAPCWEDGKDHGAKSSTSSDMIAGYNLGRFAERNLGAFQRLAAKGEARRVYAPIPGWVMGEPYPEMATRVVLRPNGIGLVGRALYALSQGSDDRSYRKWQPLYGIGQDYERHVQTVSILTDGLASELARKGSLDPTPTETSPDTQLTDVTLNEFDALKRFAESEPKNYFFQAVLGRYTGEMSTAITLLLDPETPIPSYVRGKHAEAYALIHWLASAQVVLERYGKGK